MIQKTLDDIKIIKIGLSGWIGITDETGKRHDVCVKKCLIDKHNKKLIITGHNGEWVINPNQMDLTH